MNNPHCNIDKLGEGCRALGLDLPREQLNLMVLHLELLSKWNKRLNLTAVDSPHDMLIHHLLDSLSVVPMIKGERVLDVGTGAGFPGFPIALARPKLCVTLLDSRGKRVEFLRHVKIKTAATNVSVVQSRVEDFRADEKFDTLVARAFSSLNTLVTQTRALQGEGIRILAMKGKIPDEEISDLPEEMEKRVRIHKLEVPFLDADRHLVTIDF